jgi:hypothetical protein
MVRFVRMRYPRKLRILPTLREDGVVAAEFVLLFPLFLLIVGAIVELGHLWYVDHVITNASREGARAGVVYVANPAGGRQVWATNAATTAINNYLGTGKNYMLPLVPQPVIKCTFPNGANSGQPLTVDITVSKVALILSDFSIAGFDKLTITGKTTMILE